MSEHIFAIGHLGTYCIQCFCSENEKDKPCPGSIQFDPQDLSARLDAAEAKIESLERELLQLREWLKELAYPTLDG